MDNKCKKILDLYGKIVDSREGINDALSSSLNKNDIKELKNFLSYEMRCVSDFIFDINEIINPYTIFPEDIRGQVKSQVEFLEKEFGIQVDLFRLLGNISYNKIKKGIKLTIVPDISYDDLYKKLIEVFGDKNVSDNTEFTMSHIDGYEEDRTRKDIYTVYTSLENGADQFNFNRSGAISCIIDELNKKSLGSANLREFILILIKSVRSDKYDFNLIKDTKLGVACIGSCSANRVAFPFFYINQGMINIDFCTPQDGLSADATTCLVYS